MSKTIIKAKTITPAKKAAKKTEAKKVETEKAPLPALANDASPELEKAIAQAFKICKTLKTKHTHKSCERLSKADKYQIKVPATAKSAVSKLHLKLTELNRLNDRMSIGQSRKLAVLALISSGTLSTVPKTLGEYCKSVLAPLCASGHITCPYHTSSDDELIFVSGPNMSRAHLQASATDALKMLLGYAFSEQTCRGSVAQTDLLDMAFFPSCKFISDALASHNK